MTKHFLSAIFLTAIALACRPAEPKMFRKSAVIMDTLVTITAVSDSDKKADTAIDSAMAEIRGLESLISFWSQESEISDINRRAGGGAVAVSPATIDIIEKAIYISEETGGAFDATIGPVIRLYDFKEKRRPDKRQLMEKLALVNYREMSLNRSASTAFLKVKGMSFDTGGIAKGYAADKAVALLKKMGIKAGLVAVAGDIRAFGNKPDGKPWFVGIRNPRPKGMDEDIMATVELRDEAISTSGDYERHFEEGGKLYHHILDPKTGTSALGLRSVTVVSKEGYLSDGLSTGIFVMGAEAGVKLLTKLGAEGILVDSQGKIIVTEGLKSRVIFNEN